MAHHDHSKQEGDQELQREIGLISSEESELEILAAYDADQLSLQDPSLQLREQIRTTAANTFKKDRRINIRLSDHDLVGIQKIAAEKGIPYQSLISGLIHQFVEGDLVGRKSAML
jgi:predicted DNA binding CopG/RHH family protein